jgi:hypothetical protein
MKKTTIKPQKPSDQVTRPPETAPEEPAQPGSPDKEPLQPSFCENAAYRFSDQISKWTSPLVVPLGPSSPDDGHIFQSWNRQQAA